jgi:hypothetical protein
MATDTRHWHDMAKVKHAHVNLPASGHTHGRDDDGVHGIDTYGDHEHMIRSGRVVRWDVIGTTAERTEQAIRLAEAAVHDAIGEALIRTFPEATTGDERPDTVFALTAEIASTVRAWVEDNVTTMPERAADDAADLRAMRTDPDYWAKRAARADVDRIEQEVRARDPLAGPAQYAAALTKAAQAADETAAVVPVRIGTTGAQVQCAECGRPVSLIVATQTRFCDGPDAYPDHVPAPAFYPGRVTARSLGAFLWSLPEQDTPVLIGAPQGWYSYVGEQHAPSEANGYALPTLDVGESWDATDL